MGPEKCPFCGQEIDAGAIKCFFCSADLNEQSIEHRLEQLHQEEDKKIRKISRQFILQALVIIIFICVAVFFVITRRTYIFPRTPPTMDSFVRLNAKVIYTGAQFTISNNDSYDWSNVELQISSEKIGSDFNFRVPKISAGQSYTVHATKFVMKNGDCFDPYKMKPRRFRIRCESPNGENGSYFAKWE
jgi:hypothetical protein